MAYCEYKKSAVLLGVKNLTFYVVIGLKTKLKVNIVSSMKSKAHILNAFPNVKLFSYFERCIQLKTELL